jgi:predicted transport protein
MPLFKLNGTVLTKIREEDFELEKQIQKISEENLKSIFGLNFIQSEFELHGLRIDTLAFSPETKSFVIIEYKNDRNFSVIDQGFAYLSLLLNNKADFILAYNESDAVNEPDIDEDGNISALIPDVGKMLKKEDVDWEQTRIYFVAPEYTGYQKKAVEFKDLPIFLFTIKRYANDLISYEQLQAPEKSESIKTISKSGVIQKVSKEVRVYTEEDHLAFADAETQDLYREFLTSLSQFGGFNYKPMKEYIAFKRHTNFLDIEVQKHRLKIHLNLKKGELKDPFNLARDVSNIGHWGNGDYELLLHKSSDIASIIALVKQSYDRN